MNSAFSLAVIILLFGAQAQASGIKGSSGSASTRIISAAPVDAPLTFASSHKVHRYLAGSTLTGPAISTGTVYTSGYRPLSAPLVSTGFQGFRTVPVVTGSVHSPRVILSAPQGAPIISSSPHFLSAPIVSQPSLGVQVIRPITTVRTVEYKPITISQPTASAPILTSSSTLHPGISGLSGWQFPLNQVNLMPSMHGTRMIYTGGIQGAPETRYISMPISGITTTVPRRRIFRAPETREIMPDSNLDTTENVKPTLGQDDTQRQIQSTKS